MLDNRLRTFISYSRENQQFALKLAYELKSANFAVWMDQYDIPTGARWDDEIEKALRECEIFMFIMTPASVASENAKDEMGYAIDHGKHILPVLLEECEIPLRLSRLQYVDFTQKSFNEGIKSAEELLSELMNKDETSVLEEASPAIRDTDQKEYRRAVEEPKTVPSKKGGRSYPSQSGSTNVARIDGRGKRISKWILAGIAGIIILFTVSALLVIPFIMPPTPTQTATLRPTQTIMPTFSPVPTITATPTPVALSTFTEEFDEGSMWDKNWTLKFRNGDPNKQMNFRYAIADGSIVFNLNHEYIWAYFLYNPVVIYSNVEMEIVIEDLKSTETIALVCQYSDKGWYEFDINGGGEYDLRYVDNMDSDADLEENLIKKGGIQGFHYYWEEPSENKIRANCDGNKLSLSVNNAEILKNYPSKLDVLEQGQIGIAVRSDEIYPVRVVLKSITVREP